MRAQQEGWIRERAGLDARGPRGAGDGRRRLLSRFRGLRDRPLPPDAALDPYDIGGDLPEDGVEPVAAEPEFAEPEFAEPEFAEPPPAEPAWTPPAPPVVDDRNVRAVPTGAESRAVRALEYFNVSEFPKTVSGVSRSLGSPIVTVLAPQGHASVVTVVVAWELCWYRYAIDLAEREGDVQLVGQGYELDELSEDERAANAVADERGYLATAA